MSNKSILIVEDDKPIREMMKTLLEIEGYEVIATSNGKEGIDAMEKKGNPSLILLDMMMPIMNGWDFLDIVRSNPKTSKLPVVIVSAYSETAKSLKPKAFVPKPVQYSTLLKAIAECAT